MKKIYFLILTVLLLSATSCTYIKHCPTYTGSRSDRGEMKMKAKTFSHMQKKVFRKNSLALR